MLILRSSLHSALKNQRLIVRQFATSGRSMVIHTLRGDALIKKANNGKKHQMTSLSIPYGNFSQQSRGLSKSSLDELTKMVEDDIEYLNQLLSKKDKTIESLEQKIKDMEKENIEKDLYYDAICAAKTKEIFEKIENSPEFMNSTTRETRKDRWTDYIRNSEEGRAIMVKFRNKYGNTESKSDDELGQGMSDYFDRCCEAIEKVRKK